MSNQTTVGTGGIGFTGLLALIFITLKLLSIQPVAGWSWLWVLAPVWMPFLIVFGVLGIIVIGWVIVVLVGKGKITVKKRGKKAGSWPR